jgi:hypothetical protein
MPVRAPNDIEFSGERKRVRCNEVLGRAFDPAGRATIPHLDVKRHDTPVWQRCVAESTVTGSFSERACGSR